MKFTIAIPAYKAKYLAECLDSILAQSYPDFEVIVVNDASPENIDAVIEKYATVSYHKNDKNIGAIDVVDNWNKCLSYAKGDFFILMGDDDKMCPSYLDEFARLIERFPICNVYHCRSKIINEQSLHLGFTEPRPEFESVYDSILQRIKDKRTFFISDYVFRTETLKRNGGFYKLPLAWASDDISSYIAAIENGIAHTNSPVFIYRKNAQTISSTGSVDIKMRAIHQEEMWLKDFLSKEPVNEIDKLLRKSINKDLRKFIQKKKMFTVFSASKGSLMIDFFKAIRLRKKYDITFNELLYAGLQTIKDNRASRYEKNK